MHTLFNRTVAKALVLASLTLLSICFNQSARADVLDSVKNQTKLIRDLKDVYRAFNINRIITDQHDKVEVFIEGDSKVERAKMLSGFIAACENLKHTYFFNDTLSRYAQGYLNASIQNYRILIIEGISGVKFKKDQKAYAVIEDKYRTYLGKTYPEERFVNMPEDKYWQLNDKKNYIKSPEYATYLKLKKTNLKGALALLEKIAKQTTNFQEYSIYEIEIADQYVKRNDKLGADSYMRAVAKYQSILDQKKYSIYLFEAWLKWRIVQQQNGGLSKTSPIPNDKYDREREQVILTLLKYIATAPGDKMAINEALVIGTHDVIRRIGDYPYGNQNTVEYHETFDDKK